MLYDALNSPIVRHEQTTARAAVLIFICPHCTQMFYFTDTIPSHVTEQTRAMFTPCVHFRGVQVSKDGSAALFEEQAS